MPTLVGTARSQVSQDISWSAQVDHDRIVLQQANFFQLRCQPIPSAEPIQFVSDCVVPENDVATSHASQSMDSLAVRHHSAEFADTNPTGAPWNWKTPCILPSACPWGREKIEPRPIDWQRLLQNLYAPSCGKSASDLLLVKRCFVFTKNGHSVVLIWQA